MECIDPFDPHPNLMVSRNTRVCHTHSLSHTLIHNSPIYPPTHTHTHTLSLSLTHSHHANKKGRLHTRVHVGCPPGLSLVFDDIITQSHDNQFCTPSANVSCYYFGNGEVNIYTTSQDIVKNVIFRTIYRTS